MISSSVCFHFWFQNFFQSSWTNLYSKCFVWYEFRETKSNGIQTNSRSIYIENSEKGGFCVGGAIMEMPGKAERSKVWLWFGLSLLSVCLSYKEIQKNTEEKYNGLKGLLASGPWKPSGPLDFLLRHSSRVTHVPIHLTSKSIRGGWASSAHTMHCNVIDELWCIIQCTGVQCIK